MDMKGAKNSSATQSERKGAASSVALDLGTAAPSPVSSSTANLPVSRNSSIYA